jgi:hypothetical protein
LLKRTKRHAWVLRPDIDFSYQKAELRLGLFLALWRGNLGVSDGKAKN